MMRQEKVSDYPRPPRLEPSVDHVLVLVGGEVLFQGREHNAFWKPSTLPLITSRQMASTHPS